MMRMKKETGGGGEENGVGGGVGKTFAEKEGRASGLDLGGETRHFLIYFYFQS